MAAPGARETILYGGVVAGILDLLDAFVVFGYLGVNKLRILQSIASGAFGAEAFKGGAATAAAGLAFHFLIALIVATVYHAAARKMRVLIERPFLCGLAYGVGAFLVMQYVVLPLSAYRVRPLSWPLIANAVLIHAFGVGLPIALTAAWSTRRRPTLAIHPSSALPS
jgi:hypothetical protein